MKSTKESSQQKKVLLNRRNNLLISISGGIYKKDIHSESYHGDKIDKASASTNIEMNSILSNMKRMEIKALDRTIKKTDEDKYGTCEMCGEKISKKRLTVLPLTPFYKDCQSKIEKEKEETRRITH